MIKYDSLEAYRKSLPEISLPHLDGVIDIIKELPYFEVNMSYGVPSFNLKEKAKYSERIMVTCYKEHISIYPHKETLHVFKDKLAIYKVLKGTIQIRYANPLDKELLKEVLLHSYHVVN